MTLPPYVAQKGSTQMAVFGLKTGGRIRLNDSHADPERCGLRGT